MSPTAGRASAATTSTMSSKEESASVTIEAGVPDVDEPDLTAEEKARERARSIIGRVISDRYRVVELIAMGGMGAVYLGDHVHMKKRVAVKILHPASEDQPEIVTRFEREALVGAHVRHPSVASATDFGKLEDGSYFLILEYVEGKNLAEIIKEGRLSLRRATSIAAHLASGLDAAHALGIVHRDLKPRNIMVGNDGLPKLIDFGFAKVSVDKLPLTGNKDERGHKPLSRLTGVGVIFGTIAYLAPEAAHGMDAVDARSDLYALGVILYEMVTGKHPFDATDPVELFSQHRMTPPPPLEERAPGLVVPPELEAVIRKLLEKDPYERYQTAAEVVEALEAVPLPEEPDAESVAVRKSSRTPLTPLPGPSSKPAPPPPSRATADTLAEAPPPPAPVKAVAGNTSPLLYAVAVIAVAAIGAAIFFATQREPPTPVPVASDPAPTVTPPEPAPAAPTTPAPADLPDATAASTETATPAETDPAPTAEPADAPPPSDGTDWAASLVQAHRGRAWGEAEKAFFALAKQDPAAFKRKEIVKATRDLVAALAIEADGRADAIFEVLTDKLGTDGLDVLYEIVESLGKSQAAERAAAILRKKEVLDRATPAMRVAFELRDAPCNEKVAMFDRAAKEGDDRALTALLNFGRGCFPKSKPLDRAIIDLKKRLDDEKSGRQ
ncbi:serine/threonine-protein kinase [Polyangium aurulentum]|uniref:serine/threonine-protein kinase n=1 Tax=Polyangium aurulentum TaxID=2567896 RepID=UPI00146AAD90|nr:serine/threonine-protein kinase [Polyangium aurulentum]UQA60927.1 serine/threonine protein kinase [Polyangium aurulentum]